MKENTYTEKKVNVLRRFTSSFKGLSGLVTKNTYMEYLVELPCGKREYKSEKELINMKVL